MNRALKVDVFSRVNLAALSIRVYPPSAGPSYFEDPGSTPLRFIQVQTFTRNHWSGSLVILTKSWWFQPINPALRIQTNTPPDRGLDFGTGSKAPSEKNRFLVRGPNPGFLGHTNGSLGLNNLCTSPSNCES